MAKVTLEQIQAAIDQINKSITGNAGKIKSSAADFVKQFNSAEDAARSLETTMKGVRQEILESSTGLDDLKSRFNDIGKELNKQDTAYKSMNKSFGKLRSYAEDLSDIQYDLAASSLKETRSLKNKVNLEFNRLKNQAKYLQQQISSGELQGEELTKAQELLQFSIDKVKVLEDQVGYQDQFNKSIDETFKRQKRVQNALGITGKLISGLGGLLEKVGFGDFSEEINMAKEQMGSLAVEITNNGEKAAGFMGTMKVGLVGLKSLGKSIGAALSDPLVIITILYKTIKGLINLMSEFAKGVSDVGKAFGIAGQQAQDTYQTIRETQDLYHFPEELLQGQQKYNEAVGFNLAYNKENAALMQDLTQYLGLSDQAAGQLVRRSRILGVDFKSMDKSMAKITTQFNKQNKTAVPYAKVLEKVANASGTTLFNIKGGEAGLAKAAATAARYGREMNDIKNAAEQLLNFEDSIGAELEAELFLNKDLNLEKLRYAALTGDITTQAKEQERLIMQNWKGLKGNVLAQQAFAKSIGMSADEVARIAEQQEIERKLTPQQRIEAQATAELQAKQAKEAETFNRQLTLAINSLKTALLPLVQAITPFFQAMAKAMAGISSALGGTTGKTILKILGFAAGGALAIKGLQKLKGAFSGGLVESTQEFIGGDKPGTKQRSFLEKLLGGKGTLGASASNPMYVYVVNQGGGGGAGDILDMFDSKKGGSLGKAPKASFLKKLKNPRTMLKALARQGGATAGKIGFKSLAKGLGKAALKGAGGLGSIAGGIALDYASESQLQKAAELDKKAKFATDKIVKKELEEKAEKAKTLGQAANVGSAALTGAGLGATIGAGFFGIGAVPGAAIGGILGAGYGLLSNTFGGEEEKEMAIGGIVNKPTKALVGEAGPEAVIPLDKFYAKLDELIAVVKQGGDVYLDATKVGTAMAVSTYKVQ